MSILRTIFSLLRQTFEEWNNDSAPRLAAALSYFTAFSIAPLFVVVIAIVGLVLNAQGVQDNIIAEVRASMGADAAALIGDVIENVSQPRESIFATVIGLIGLLFGAIGVFEQLKSALNTVWDAKPKPAKNGVIAFITGKVLNFGMLLVVGFLLLVSLIITSVVASIGTVIVGVVPAVEALLQFINFFISFAVTTVLFALIFKFLPDVKIAWRDVGVGAVVTSILFSIGRFALGLYLGNTGTASLYGAAGALAVVLIWVFYSAQILLFGAEFTQVFAKTYGSFQNETAIKPVPVPVDLPVTTAGAVPSVSVAVAQQMHGALAYSAPATPSRASVQAANAQKPNTLLNIVILVGMLVGALIAGRSRAQT